MDLLRSWTVAVAVYIAASVLSASAAVMAGDPDLLKGTSGAVTWAAGSSLLIYLAMAVLSALLHPVPQRDDPRRHALAVLGVPAVTVVGGAVFGVFQGVAAAGNAVSAAAGVAGALTGWAVVTRLRARRRRPKSEVGSGGYF